MTNYKCESLKETPVKDFPICDFAHLSVGEMAEMNYAWRRRNTPYSVGALPIREGRSCPPRELLAKSLGKEYFEKEN